MSIIYFFIFFVLFLIFSVKCNIKLLYSKVILTKNIRIYHSSLCVLLKNQPKYHSYNH